jgi:hypothetical protein
MVKQTFDLAQPRNEDEMELVGILGALIIIAALLSPIALIIYLFIKM